MNDMYWRFRAWHLYCFWRDWSSSAEDPLLFPNKPLLFPLQTYTGSALPIEVSIYAPIWGCSAQFEQILHKDPHREQGQQELLVRRSNFQFHPQAEIGSSVIWKHYSNCRGCIDELSAARERWLCCVFWFVVPIDYDLVKKPWMTLPGTWRACRFSLKPGIIETVGVQT